MTNLSIDRDAAFLFGSILYKSYQEGRTAQNVLEIPHLAGTIASIIYEGAHNESEIMEMARVLGVENTTATVSHVLDTYCGADPMSKLWHKNCRGKYHLNFDFGIYHYTNVWPVISASDWNIA